jgi:membrane protein implicated in regulation of membrane protease activity
VLPDIEIAYYHWIILCLGFWILELLKIGRISATLVAAAGVMVVITYLAPDLHWGWQVWGFIMMMALGSIVYLRQLPPLSEEERAERKRQEIMTAADLVGDQGNSEFPENLPLAAYQRNKDIEEEYGKPDLSYWLAFEDALVDHRKLALVYAYHVLSGLKGLSLDEARIKLNTYTLALYDTKKQGQLLHRQKQMLSQPRIYGFLYMNGKWTGRDKRKFEEEINDLVAALDSDWAVKYRGKLNASKVRRAVKMIRSQQVA